MLDVVPAGSLADGVTLSRLGKGGPKWGVVRLKLQRRFLDWKRGQSLAWGAGPAVDRDDFGEIQVLGSDDAVGTVACQS